MAKDSVMVGIADLPNGIIVIRDGGSVLDANTAMLDLLGCDRDWVTGQPLSSVMTRPSAILYHSSIYPQLRSSGHVSEAYLDFRRQDGGDVPALCTATMRRGSPAQDILISVTRMTDRRRLEEDLLRTRRITEQVPGVMYQYLLRADGTRRIPYASEALRDIFGLSPMEVSSDATPLLQRLHEDDVEAFELSLEHSASKLISWRHQFRARRSAGAPCRWLEGSATTERLADGATLWHGFIQDITDRRGVETAMREKEASDQANRAKSEFLARVSHELRTPLNAIFGFAQVLAIDKLHPLHAFQQQRVRHIEEAGRDLLHLVDEVLDITRIESGSVGLQPEWVDVESLFARIVRLVEGPARSRGIRIDIAVCPKLKVHADPTRLSQIVSNLLSNAVKYNREQGCVTLSCSANRGSVVFSVRDTGDGLSDEQVTHLFEPFNRLGAERTAVQGTGLGLVIVKRLVDSMDGSMMVKSRPGHGSTFRVVLPLRSAKSAKRADDPVTLPGPFDGASQRPVWRLLYVEDNPVNALVMKAICELKQEFELHIEATGSTAIAWVKRNPVDLLLLDMHLPDFDGITLLRELQRTMGADIPPAIAVSADAMPEFVESAKLAGFEHYLTKPLDVTHTVHLIESALQRRMSVDKAA